MRLTKPASTNPMKAMNAPMPAAIAERIGDVQRRDDLETLSENGRAVAEREYSFEAAVARYRRILETV